MIIDITIPIRLVCAVRFLNRKFQLPSMIVSQKLIPLFFYNIKNPECFRNKLECTPFVLWRRRYHILIRIIIYVTQMVHQFAECGAKALTCCSVYTSAMYCTPAVTVTTIPQSEWESLSYIYPRIMSRYPIRYWIFSKSKHTTFSHHHNSELP